MQIKLMLLLLLKIAFPRTKFGRRTLDKRGSFGTCFLATSCVTYISIRLISDTKCTHSKKVYFSMWFLKFYAENLGNDLQGPQKIPTNWKLHYPSLSLMVRHSDKRLVKRYRGVGRCREGVGHEVLSLVQGVGLAIFSYP